MKFKKMTALLLVLAMVMSLVPVNALAETSDFTDDTDFYELYDFPDISELLENQSIVPLNATGTNRPFPQAGQDTGIMVNLLHPNGIAPGANPREADLNILRQFAQLIDPTHHPHHNARGLSNTAHAIFASNDTNSLYMVDPPSRASATEFRMVLYNPDGTGPGLVNSVTVCEAMGYGMLMLVLLAGSEDIVLGGAYGNRTMRQVLHTGLPSQLRSQFSAQPGQANSVSFQTYFDAMFRSLRHWPSFNVTANGHVNSSYPNAPTLNNYGGSLGGVVPTPGTTRRSYQMGWALNHTGVNPGNFQRTTGPSTATDGTFDMAYALILASEQWGNAPVWGYRNAAERVHSYRDWAVRMVGEIWETSVHHSRHAGNSATSVSNAGYYLKIGSWAGSNSASGRLSRPSDHMIQHMRAFDAICTNPNSNWQRVIDVTHASHSFVRNIPAAGGTGANSTGFLPDFIRHTGGGWQNATWEIPAQNNTSGNFHETPFDGAVHWNAGRVPWRQGVDVLFAGTRPNEDITIQRINTWQSNNWNAGARDGGMRGRWLDGRESGAGGTTNSNFFSGPYTIPAAIYGNQTWFNNVWNLNASGHMAVLGNSNWRRFNYFGDYVSILSQIAASGNEWTPVGHTLEIVNGRTIGNRTTVQRVAPGARVRLEATGTFSGWTLPQGVSFAPGSSNTATTFIIMPRVARNEAHRTFVVRNGGGTSFTVTRNSASTVPAANMTISPTSATQGQQITVTVTPPANQRIRAGTFSVTGTNVTATINNNVATFSMPGANTSITVNATFENIPASRTITRNSASTVPAANMTINPTSATQGQQITVTVNPPSGQEITPGSFSVNVSGTPSVTATINNNVATFTMPDRDVNVTVNATFRTPAAPSTAVAFVYMFTNPEASWPGFNNTAPNTHLQFDITQNQQVTLTLPPWPNSDTTLHATHRDIYIAQPTAATNPSRLPVTLHQIRINGTPVTGTMPAQSAPGARWMVAGSLNAGGRTIEIAGANATSQPGFAAAGYELRTFFPAQNAFTIPNGAIVEFVFNVGTVNNTFNVTRATASTVPAANMTISPTSATQGQQITVTVNPPSGQEITPGTFSVTGTGVSASISGNQATFSMPGANTAITVNATFRTPSFNVTRATASTVPAANMTISPTSATQGQQITVTVNPPSGQEITPGTFSVTGTGVSASISGNQATFSMPGANTAITVNATFRTPSFNVTRATASTVPAANMTISPTSATQGQQITVTVNPPANQIIRPGSFSVTVSGTPAITPAINNNVATFTMPARNVDVTVNAAFDPASTDGRRDLEIRIPRADIPLGTAVIGVSINVPGLIVVEPGRNPLTSQGIFNSVPNADRFFNMTFNNNLSHSGATTVVGTQPLFATAIAGTAGAAPAMVNSVPAADVAWASSFSDMGFFLTQGMAWWVGADDFNPSFNTAAAGLTTRPTNDLVITIPDVLHTERMRNAGATINISFQGNGQFSEPDQWGGRNLTLQEYPDNPNFAGIVIPMFPEAAPTVTVLGTATNAVGAGTRTHAVGDIVYIFAGVNPGHSFSHWDVQPATAVQNFGWNRRSDTFRVVSSATITAIWSPMPIPFRGNAFVELDSNGHRLPNQTLKQADINILRRYLLATDKNAFIAANPNFCWVNANVSGVGDINTADLTRLTLIVSQQ